MEDFPSILLISASAGSGKTHYLSQRFINLLLSKNAPHNDLANILSITFTNNAAKEMKERILTYLKESALTEKTKKEYENLVNTIIERYSDFQVQTIDSFINRILHGSAIELGLSPDVEVTKSYKEIVETSLSDLFKDIGEKISTDEIDKFLTLLRKDMSSFSWNPALDIERKFYNFLKKEKKYLEEIELPHREYITLQEKISELLKIYNEICSTNKDSIKEGVHEKLSGRSPDEVDIKMLMKVLSREYLWFDGKKKKKNADIINYYKDCLMDLFSEILYYYAVANYYPYISIYCLFKNYLERTKKKLGVIHIDDINKKLSKYIAYETTPEIYYSLGTRIYHFLIDEFQDTSQLQWKNLLPLIEEALSSGGSLSAVGDIKQAIYIFRDADYKIMKDLMDRIISGDREHPLLRIVGERAKVEELSVNFRSGGKILEYVDDIFKNRLKRSEIIKDDVCGLTNYTQCPSKEKENLGCVKTIFVEKGKSENEEKNIILNLLEDILTRYSPRDIAILARRKKEVEKIAEYLTEKNIPVAPYSALDIRKRKIIREIVFFLQFLASPIDNLSFATFILGDVFLSATGVDKNEIHNFLFKRKRERKEEYLYILFKEEERFKNVWDDFIEELFNCVGYLPLYDIVVLTVKKFSVFENFPNEAGHILKFLEAIHTIQIRGKDNIRDVFFTVEEEEEETELFSIILPDYIDAVKIMTFHLAKGLGFPVVINVLYDSQYPQDPMYFELEDGKLRVYYIIREFAEFSPELFKIREKAKLQEKIQDLNLLYVILTRPKYELYNIVVYDEKRSCMELRLFEVG